MRFLKTCCCGCTLRTGTIIIGSLGLIFATMNLCLTITTMVLLEKVSDEVSNKTSRKSDLSSDIGNKTNDVVPKNDVNNETNSVLFFTLKSLTTILLSMIAVDASVSVITSILLIIGAAKGLVTVCWPIDLNLGSATGNKMVLCSMMGYMWLLLPWIANVSLGLIGYVCTSIYTLVKISQETSGGIELLLLLIISGVVALDFYLLMIVISHFEELKKNTRSKDGSNFGKIYSTPSPWSSTTQIEDIRI